TLDDLNERIMLRASAPTSESYTAKLLGDGIERCARKFGEEAVEAVIAAVSTDKGAVTAEAADVLYLLLVLLKASGVTLDEVMVVLEQRTAQSGIEEKAGRGR